MKKFLVLYRSTSSAMDQIKNSTPEQRKTGMDMWMTWSKKAGHALLDMGSPLTEAAHLQGKPGSGFIGGYSIVQAENVDAARRIFEGHPHFMAPGASIEILEMLSMSGS